MLLLKCVKSAGYGVFFNDWYGYGYGKILCSKHGAYYGKSTGCFGSAEYGYGISDVKYTGFLFSILMSVSDQYFIRIHPVSNMY